MDFFTWEILLTDGGAMLATALITQYTKDWKGIKKIPTQIWSYIVAMILMALAHVFVDEVITIKAIALCAINAFIVGLAANGGYAAVLKIKDSVKKEE